MIRTRPMRTCTISEGLAPIKKIMDRHGAHCSPEEFHQAVNISFHNFDAEVYDQEHSNMWESLPREFDRLVTDCIAVSNIGDDLRLLDIGCGTGLASDCLLRTELGTRIKSIDLLDTSPAMLKQVAERAKRWNVPVSIIEGLIDAVPKGKKYSLIVTCSVLHHIPDVPDFLRTIRTLQSDGGMYLHLQDPNGDYSTDPEYLQRVARVETRKILSGSISRFTPKRLLGRICRELSGKQHHSYCDKTNRALLESGVIQSPLSVAEIYSITDIHVADGAGISIQKMKYWMQGYELISARSYAFFGKLWSDLCPNFRKLEEELAEKNALNGMHLGAAWKLQ
jgi:2-polyprenyl-3-methyl-5-hydroxy-6-metoxy-1,4-benzoquinol methylase